MCSNTKKGKPCYKGPSAYRPISLLSCFGKILETVLSKRVYNAARRTGAISQNQMGSVLHYSATDILAVTLAPVTAAIIHETEQQKSAAKYRHHQKASLITQDVSGAFNNRDPDILIEVMRRKAMLLYIVNWVQQFLSNITLSFSFDGQIEPPTSFSSGLPQGFPISPVLFLIMANIITEAPPTVTEKATSYVDDVSLTQIAPTYQESTRRLMERSQEQALRANMIELSLAADKYELIHLSVLNKFFDFTNQDHFTDPIIQSTTNNRSLKIRLSDKIKILGVTIDKFLNFKQQAYITASKGLQTLGSQGLGISAYIANHLIRVAVLPTMLWASPIWWNKTPSVLDPLSKAYNKMARWITGLPITTKISNLLTCAHLPPLDAYLDYLTATYVVRQSFLPIDHTINTIPRIRDNPRRMTLPGLPTILNSIYWIYRSQPRLEHYAFHA
jgi:hypothetical protein